jgi:hypothetical protein
MGLTYTRSFGTVEAAGGADVVLLTVPMVDTYVIRDLVGYVETSVDGFLSFYLVTGHTLTLAWFDFSKTGSQHLELRQVLPAGSELHAVSSATSWRAMATGYVFRD